MKTNIGVWIDRTTAIIVRINGKEYNTVTVTSDLQVARHPRCGTGGRCTIIPENRMKQRKHEIVKKYYHAIVEKIRDAGTILILGPGIAKSEFVNELKSMKYIRSRIVGIKKADKMSPRHLEMKVTEFFNSFASKTITQTSILATLR